MNVIEALSNAQAEISRRALSGEFEEKLRVVRTRRESLESETKARLKEEMKERKKSSHHKKSLAKSVDNRSQEAKARNAQILNQISKESTDADRERNNYSPHLDEQIRYYKDKYGKLVEQSYPEWERQSISRRTSSNGSGIFSNGFSNSSRKLLASSMDSTPSGPVFSSPSNYASNRIADARNGLYNASNSSSASTIFPNASRHSLNLASKLSSANNSQARDASSPSQLLISACSSLASSSTLNPTSGTSSFQALKTSSQNAPEVKNFSTILEETASQNELFNRASSDKVNNAEKGKSLEAMVEEAVKKALESMSSPKKEEKVRKSETSKKEAKGKQTERRSSKHHDEDGRIVFTSEKIAKSPANLSEESIHEIFKGSKNLDLKVLITNEGRSGKKKVIEQTPLQDTEREPKDYRERTKKLLQNLSVDSLASLPSDELEVASASTENDEKQHKVNLKGSSSRAAPVPSPLKTSSNEEHKESPNRRRNSSSQSAGMIDCLLSYIDEFYEGGKNVYLDNTNDSVRREIIEAAEKQYENQSRSRSSKRANSGTRSPSPAKMLITIEGISGWSVNAVSDAVLFYLKNVDGGLLPKEFIPFIPIHEDELSEFNFNQVLRRDCASVLQALIRSLRNVVDKEPRKKGEVVMSVAKALVPIEMAKRSDNARAFIKLARLLAVKLPKTMQDRDIIVTIERTKDMNNLPTMFPSSVINTSS